MPHDWHTSRIQQARCLRGFTQQQLADRAGIPSGSISKYECGSRMPGGDNLRKMARALGVSSDFLSGVSDEIGGSRAGDELWKRFAELTSDHRQVVADLIAVLHKRRAA
jgi:transcriptional regulator with XRE-family HTH domain